MGFIALIMVSGILIYGFKAISEKSPSPIPTTTRLRTSSTTTSTIEQGGDAAFVTTTSTIQASTSTTSTIPPYAELSVDTVGRCSNTLRGKMNTVVATLEDSVFSLKWGNPPDPSIYYSCDGAEGILFDRIMFKGGRSIEPGSYANNSYRLAAKCGRNQPVEDLRDCDELKIILDTGGFTRSAQEIDAVATTSTIRINTYLDKFRGLGYRKADIHIKWLCPTCVPAVNRVIIEEAGVKSRSLAYRQELSYVIYDPEIVELERIMLLANAGGTAELIEDYEL